MSSAPTGTDVVRIRLLPATDLHQTRLHYNQLAQAVERHRPDVVALVGDVLDMLEHSGKRHYDTGEAARFLAGLPVLHLLFVRGNHEDFNWPKFVAAWPHEQRPLTALHGTACAIGPLIVTGFPCLTGSEFHWCAHLTAGGNQMELNPTKSREPLASDFETWLPRLMRKIGSAGRTVWLMHESPVGLPLAHPQVFNPAWTEAVERFGPLLVVSGHDHETPLMNNTWHTRLGKTLCVNAGQLDSQLHYTLVDFEFPKNSPCLPLKITVRAFPWGKEVVV